MKYRPEIDGLRAISVFSVIIYHAKISYSGSTLLQGGFLGVDIFFVISGYLITTLILKEIQSNNNFRFLNFYERRIRRILPALLTVTIFSCFIAYYLFLPNQLIDFVQSVLGSLFFYSNYFFYFSGEEYNAAPSLMVPLLHYWSLGVEEQYYIIFPFILYFLYKKKLQFLLYFLILILSVSFLSSIININPVFNFFSLHTRVWELMIGALVAYLLFRKIDTSSDTTKSFIVYFGMALIVFSFFFINDNHNFLALKSVPAVFGVSCIIYFSNQNNLLIKLLSYKFVTFFGLISYSLYLWHYPIFSFSRIAGLIQNDIINKIIIGFSVILISIISYFIIERPFRNKNTINKKTLFLAVGSSYIFLIFFSLFIILKEGAPNRFPQIFFQKYSFENFEGKIKFNTEGNNGEIILIGDSHAETLSNELNKAAIKNSYKLKRFHTHMLLPNVYEYDLVNKKIDNNFQTKNEDIIKYLNQSSGSTVVIYNYYSLRILEKDANNKQFRKIFVASQSSNNKNSNFKERFDKVKSTFIKTLEQISKNHEVILIDPSPEFRVSVPIALLRKIIFTDRSTMPIVTSDYNSFLKKRELIFQMLDEIPSKIKRINVEKYFCNNQVKNKCIGNTNENLLFSDNHHLSNYASKYVVDEIMNLLKKK